jgi:uncharacterized protein YrrD
MDKYNTVNLEEQFRGLVVLNTETVRELGVVTDVLIHPLKGTVTSIVYRKAWGKEADMKADNFVIHADSKAVIAFGLGVFDGSDNRPAADSGVRAFDQILRSDVVTEDGRMLGRVTEIYVQSNPVAIIYRVTSSIWHRYFGGGLYIAGDVVSGYSQLGSRLIVPADTRQRRAFRSLAETITSWRRGVAAV